MFRAFILGLVLLGTPAFSLTGAELGPRCGGVFDLCGFADRKSDELIIPQIYGRVFPFSNGVAAVRFEGRWGYIDTEGEMVIAPQFDLAGPFRFGRAEVLIGEHVGVIDTQGNLTVPPEYARAIPITPDITLVKTGAWRPTHYQGAEKLDIGLALISLHSMHLINAQNTWVLAPDSQLEFQIFDPEGGGLVWAAPRLDSEKTTFGLMNARTGQWVTEPMYQTIAPLSENRAAASEVIYIRERNGNDIFDENGNIVFHTPHNSVHSWENGFAAVVGHGGQTYGLLDRTGDLLGGRLFEDVRGATATRPPQVFDNGQWYKVSSDGRLVDVPEAHIVPPPTVPQPIYPFGERPRMTCASGAVLFKDAISGLYGIKAPDGTLLVAPIAPALDCFHHGIAWAAFPAEGQWCPIGSDGQRREAPNCIAVYYPEQWSHHDPEKLDGDPFTSSLLWVQNYLSFWAGEAATPPVHIGDGVQGQGKLPAFYQEMAGWN